MASSLRRLSLCASLLLAATTLFSAPAPANAASAFQVASGTCPYANKPSYSSNPADTPEAFAAEVVRLANLERAKFKLTPLQVSPILSGSALAHSQDMAARDYFSHIDPDGKSPSDRASAAGYPSAFVGENIAAGYSTPAAVMVAWMTSQGHCENLLNADYRAIGVGYVYEPNDTPIANGAGCGKYPCYRYWTLTLGDMVDGSPLPLPAEPQLPGSISFMQKPDGTGAASYSLSGPSGTDSWSVSDDASWLSASPSSGSGAVACEIKASAKGLNPGTYSATLTITTTKDGGQQVSTVDVKLIVGADLHLASLPFMAR